MPNLLRLKKVRVLRIWGEGIKFNSDISRKYILFAEDKFQLAILIIIIRYNDNLHTNDNTQVILKSEFFMDEAFDF